MGPFKFAVFTIYICFCNAGIISCQTGGLYFQIVKPKDKWIKRTVSLTGFKNKPHFIVSLTNGIYDTGDTMKGIYIDYSVRSATSAYIKVNGQYTRTEHVRVAWMACGH